VVTNASGKEEYYTQDSKYYIAVNKYGYVLEGLQLYYDGIDNTGTGTHDNSATIWKDLSGNNRHGTLTNMATSSCWKANGLTFDGTDDYVKIGEMNYPNVTLEAVADTLDTSRTEQDILSNVQGGGNSLVFISNTLYASVYIQGQSYQDIKKYTINSNTKYSISGSYDGKVLKSRLNASAYTKVSKVGAIGYPGGNTWMVLGANPSGSVAQSGYYLKGNIYSARVYNRALTEEEGYVNYQADKKRYQL